MVTTPQSASTARIAAADYLEREVQSETRHEFIAGEVIPMAGGKPNHNQVALNLAGTLNVSLRKQPYRVFITDQRLWLPEPEVYTYPDVMVTPKPVELQAGRQDTVLNPVAIAEVLSTSTRNYDLGDKFSYYRSLSSLNDYLTLDPDTPWVLHHQRQSPSQWTLTEYRDPNDSLSLCGVTLVLADLYEGISSST